MSKTKGKKRHKNARTAKIFSLVEKDREAVILGYRAEIMSVMHKFPEHSKDFSDHSELYKFACLEDLVVRFTALPEYKVAIYSPSEDLSVEVSPDVALEWLEAGKLLRIMAGGSL